MHRLQTKSTFYKSLFMDLFNKETRNNYDQIDKEYH